MKRLMVWTAVAVALAGCGSSGSDSPPPTSATTPEAATTAAPADAFVSNVEALVRSSPEDAEPVALDAPATTPENTEPVPLS